MIVEWENWWLSVEDEDEDATLYITVHWGEFYEPIHEIFKKSTRELEEYVRECDKDGKYQNRYEDATNEFKRRIWNVERNNVMSVQTAYDDIRDELENDLNECLKKAKRLVVGEDIWGYDNFRSDYAMDVYLAIKNVLEIV